MKIARVFPRITKATPDDDLSFFDAPGMFAPEVDEVHISVAFTWDKERAEWLAGQWQHVAPVRIGGPAYNQPGAAFVSGQYVRPGYVITSRGCPNKCWFCQVWRREPALIELPITSGYNVLDDNILACSQSHVEAVFAMLKKQPQRVEFTGGLEAKRLMPWHVDLLAWLKPKQLFFAYDTPDDYEPLADAAFMLWNAGFTPQSHSVRAYVLIGWPRDDFQQADFRLRQVLELGIYPMAMLWRDESGNTAKEWRSFQRQWARPAIIASRQNAKVNCRTSHNSRVTFATPMPEAVTA
jgi:hypothetical protein